MQILDEFNFHNAIQQTTGNALVFFTGIHCGSCHHLRKVLEQYQLNYNDLSIFEVDAGVSASLTQAYDVFHLPTMFLFKDGQFHCQLDAEPLPAAIHAAVEKALKQAAKEEP